MSNKRIAFEDDWTSRSNSPGRLEDNGTPSSYYNEQLARSRSKDGHSLKCSGLDDIIDSIDCIDPMMSFWKQEIIQCGFL